MLLLQKCTAVHVSCNVVQAHAGERNRLEPQQLAPRAAWEDGTQPTRDGDCTIVLLAMEETLYKVDLQLQEGPVGGEWDAGMGIGWGDEGLFKNGSRFGKTGIVEGIGSMFKEQAGGAVVECGRSVVGGSGGVGETTLMMVMEEHMLGMGLLAKEGCGAHERCCI